MQLSSSPEERFRDLFNQLDSEAVWTKLLSSNNLARVRKAAASPLSWRVFLSGTTVQPDLDKHASLDEKQPAPTNDENKAATEDTDQAKRDLNSSPHEDIAEHSPENDLHIKQPTSPQTQLNRDLKPTPATSPQPTRRTPASSPRARRDTPVKPVDEEQQIASLSALVRRRLAIASVDDQLFHKVRGALPVDDPRYEIDQGMLPGDDAGYATFEQLQREEEAFRTAQTNVYVLLGSDDDDGASPSDHLSPDDRSSPGLQSRERPTRASSTPKRPRRATAAFGLSDQMESFIRELRELCEPHRDAAQEESAQKRDVPKNIHRKAVSAASVVEELKEMEHKARIGKYERVEECISAVSACIGNQDGTFAEVLTQIEDRADVLRDEYRARKERFSSLVKVRALTTGILGSDSDMIESSDDDNEDDDDVDVSDQTGDSWVPARHAVNISFTESDLNCWPTGDDAPLLPVHPDRPRLPLFANDPDGFDDGEKDGIDSSRAGTQKRERLVDLIGADNQILRSVASLSRARKCREQVLLNWELLNRKRMAMRAAAKSPSQTSNASPVKMEDVIHSTNPSPSPKQQASPEAVSKPDSYASPCDEYEIRNDVSDMHDSTKCNEFQDSRQRILGRAVVALMCAHTGFEKASSLAVEVLTDVLEDFLERIGRSLVSCRENIDRRSANNGDRGVSLRGPSEEELIEELKLVCDSGFHGGYLDLDGYVRFDIPRGEQMLRDAELRLQAQRAKIHHELAKTEGRQVGKISLSHSEQEAKKLAESKKEASSSEALAAEIELDEDAFTFGHLTKGVTLSVLGSVKVPRKLVLDHSKSKIHDSESSPPLEDTKIAKSLNENAPDLEAMETKMDIER